jgi:hypothetical protein
LTITVASAGTPLIKTLCVDGAKNEHPDTVISRSAQQILKIPLFISLFPFCQNLERCRFDIQHIKNKCKSGNRFFEDSGIGLF